MKKIKQYVYKLCKFEITLHQHVSSLLISLDFE